MQQTENLAQNLLKFNAYRAKTKGKVERPFRYIREDFFLARSFRNLDDLNAQLRHWLDSVANSRKHATTLLVINEAFADERPHLRPLPRRGRHCASKVVGSTEDADPSKVD
ncbi:protein of unknown function (plasmid) [Shinella sp. WSC3-e]|nr:hypothetical protein SHINE37_60073 [Rhizobiaceae bacterium]CAK7262144.1 protein of unknown function [Shinella sp. WSC3-e]